MVDQIDVALLTFLGQLVGSIGAGSSSDLLGRKWTFQITMIIWGVASILAAFAWNVWALMFFRIAAVFVMIFGIETRGKVLEDISS